MLIPPPASSGPDYARLIEVLMGLRQSVDPKQPSRVFTTMRYVHLNDDDVRAAMEKARGGHNGEEGENQSEAEPAAKQAAFRV